MDMNIPVSYRTRVSSSASRTLAILIMIRHYLVFLFPGIAFSLFIYIFRKFFRRSKLFKWPLFVFLLIFSPLVTPWIVDALIFSLEVILVMKWNKALYFLFHLKKSLFSLVCSILYLLSSLFYMEAHLRGTNLIETFIAATIATVFLGNILWIFKILILKYAACKFRDKYYFEKMKHMLDNEYVLRTLLFGTSTKIYTICDALHKPCDESQPDNLFKLVLEKFTNGNPRDILEMDLLRFMKATDATKVLKQLNAEETKIIQQTSLKDWMVKVCEERKTLVDLLVHTIMAIDDLEHAILMVLAVLLFLAWLFFMGLGTIKFLSVTALSCLGVFLRTYTTFLDGIIFVFQRHLFDIDDYCIINGEKMVVKDIGIFTTVCTNEKNETEYFTNSNFATISIQNLTRSSVLTETFEVNVSNETSAENIEKLKLKIDEFLESKPEIWSPGHSLLVKEIAEKGPKYTLSVVHASKFENYEVRCRQRSELFLELKKILKEISSDSISVDSISVQ